MERVVMIVLLILASFLVQSQAQSSNVTCYNRQSPCFLKNMKCPSECPSQSSNDPKDKVCFVNCNSPICQADCKTKKPNCNGRGSACLDPRFIGGDGIVFYFHGKRDEHFALFSDRRLQINARFIGLRPPTRSRDFTWIQSLGLLFGHPSKPFSLEAKTASFWDDHVDHLRLTFAGRELSIPESPSSFWQCPDSGLRVERTSSRNGVVVVVPEVAEMAVNVVPVTKEDDRVHGYGIPRDDCFAHLEVQFRFFGLSSKVEGVLGRTYRMDFENPAKPGVVMPVLGGEDRYRTSSLLAADCRECGVFEEEKEDEEENEGNGIGVLDCGGNRASGNGIVCKK